MDLPSITLVREFTQVKLPQFASFVIFHCHLKQLISLISVYSVSCLIQFQHSLRGQVCTMQLVKHLLSTLKNYFISVVVEDVLYTEVHSQFLVLTGGEGKVDCS